MASVAVVLIGYLFIIGVVPTWVAPGRHDLSVAALRGYNVSVAYWGTLIWTVAAFAVIWVFEALRPSTVTRRPDVSAAPGRFRWTEAAVVFVLAVLAHWPPFLVRHGPYAEEGYLLSTLARMQSGQAPFVDFEFIYGPLMIASADVWMRVFGFSMEAYYWLYALLQGAFYAALVGALQRVVPRFSHRLAAFVILALFTADGLLGLNWFGWRKFMSVIAMVVIAARPWDLRNAAAGGAILAVHLAYSLEYGLTGLVACGAMYLLQLVRSGAGSLLIVGAGMTTLGVALVGGLAIASAATGNLGVYLSSTFAVLGQASANNTGAFAFHWTVHSVAAFALLSLAVVTLARGLRNPGRVAPSPDDLFLAGATAFALVGLRSGFQRADVYHMSAPFFPLALAAVAYSRTRLLAVDPGSSRLAKVLVAVAALCNVIGVAPIGRAQLTGLADGARDVFHRAPTVGPIVARGYSIQSERTTGNGDIVALAAFLAGGDLRNRPVLLYNRLWWLNAHLGLSPVGYLNYEWMYGDAMHPIERTVAAHPDLVVVMDGRSYESLTTGRYPEAGVADLSRLQRLGLLMSTVHYRQSPLEREIKDRLWRDRVGRLIEHSHVELARFGPFVVLGAPASLPAKPGAQP